MLALIVIGLLAWAWMLSALNQQIERHRQLSRRYWKAWASNREFAPPSIGNWQP